MSRSRRSERISYGEIVSAISDIKWLYEIGINTIKQTGDRAIVS